MFSFYKYDGNFHKIFIKKFDKSISGDFYLLMSLIFWLKLECMILDFPLILILQSYDQMHTAMNQFFEAMAGSIFISMRLRKVCTSLCQGTSNGRGGDTPTWWFAWKLFLKWKPITGKENHCVCVLSQRRSVSLPNRCKDIR